jgi:hypothetical protein
MTRKSLNPFIILLLGALMCVLLCVLTTPIRKQRNRERTNAYTIPLQSVVAQDLCSKLDLPETDSRCKAGAVVYATDFFHDIGRPFELNVSTYEDVQALFDKYQFDCESRVTTADGYSYFICDYDFTGDQVYWVSFMFSGEKDVLDRIMLHVDDSP